MGVGVSEKTVSNRGVLICVPGHAPRRDLSRKHVASLYYELMSVELHGHPAAAVSYLSGLLTEAKQKGRAEALREGQEQAWLSGYHAGRNWGVVNGQKVRAEQSPQPPNPYKERDGE